MTDWRYSLTQLPESYHIPVSAIGRQGFGGYLKNYHGPALEAFARDVERCFDLSSRHMRTDMTIEKVCEIFSAYFSELEGKTAFDIHMHLHGNNDGLRMKVAKALDGRIFATRQLIAVAQCVKKPQIAEEGSVAMLAWTVAMRAAGLSYEKSYNLRCLASTTPLIFDPLSLAHLASKSAALKLPATSHLKDHLSEVDVVLKLAASTVLSQAKNQHGGQSLYRRDTCRYGLDYKVNDDLVIEGSTVKVMIANMLPETAIAGLKGKKLSEVVDLPGLSAFNVCIKSAMIQKVNNSVNRPYELVLETNTFAPRHQHTIDMRAHFTDGL